MFLTSAWSGTPTTVDTHTARLTRFSHSLARVGDARLVFSVLANKLMQYTTLSGEMVPYEHAQ